MAEVLEENKNQRISLLPHYLTDQGRAEQVEHVEAAVRNTGHTTSHTPTHHTRDPTNHHGHTTRDPTSHPTGHSTRPPSVVISNDCYKHDKPYSQFQSPNCDDNRCTPSLHSEPHSKSVPNLERQASGKSDKSMLAICRSLRIPSGSNLRLGRTGGKHKMERKSIDCDSVFGKTTSSTRPAVRRSFSETGEKLHTSLTSAALIFDCSNYSRCEKPREKSKLNSKSSFKKEVESDEIIKASDIGVLEENVVYDLDFVASDTLVDHVDTVDTVESVDPVDAKDPVDSVDGVVATIAVDAGCTGIINNADAANHDNKSEDHTCRKKTATNLSSKEDQNSCSENHSKFSPSVSRRTESAEALSNSPDTTSNHGNLESEETITGATKTEEEAVTFIVGGDEDDALRLQEMLNNHDNDDNMSDDSSLWYHLDDTDEESDSEKDRDVYFDPSAGIGSKLPDTQCDICLEETSVRLRICCDAPFCDTCLDAYCKSRVDNGQVTFPCPSSSCSKPVYQSEIYIRLSAEYKQKLYRYLINANTDPRKKTCPRCSDVYTLDSEVRLQRSRSKRKKGLLVTCDTCQLEFCFMCHSPWHKDISCKKNWKGDKLLKSWAEQSRNEGQMNARKCPKCKIFIQKNFGCDHMTCSKCGSDFCYRCGERYRSVKFLGSHNSWWSVFGCKANFLPRNPPLRRLTRGSIFTAELLLAPAAGALALGVGACVLAGAVIASPVLVGFKLRKRRLQRKRRREFQELMEHDRHRRLEIRKTGDPYMENYQHMQSLGMNGLWFAHRQRAAHSLLAELAAVESLEGEVLTDAGSLADEVWSTAEPRRVTTATSLQS